MRKYLSFITISIFGMFSAASAGNNDTPPGTPTLIGLTTLSSQATATWTAPTTNGGDSILSYTVTATPGGAFCNAPATADTCTVESLVNGVTYNFSVTATNIIGTGNPSNSLSIIPGAPPAPPTSLYTVLNAHDSAHVAWSLGNNGGSPITSYKAFAVGDTALFCISPSAMNCIITGLKDDTSYTFQVAATNAAGTTLSAPSSSILMLGNPGPPTGVTATYVPGNLYVHVAWTPPASDSGTPITGYTVTTSPGGSTCGTATASADTCDVDVGLPQGVTYTATVSGVNLAGTGPGVSAPPVFTAQQPGNPVAGTMVPGDGQVTVHWTAPTSNGGSPITSYTAFNENDTVQACTAGPGATQCTITGLTDGTPYYFRIVAFNAEGPSDLFLTSGFSQSISASAATPLAVPGAPTITQAAPGNGQATFTWTAPAPVTNGATITGYEVFAISDTTKSCSVAAPTLTCTVTGLSDGTSYQFDVEALSSVGHGPVALSAALTPAMLPGAPTLGALTPGNGQVTVNWTAPASNGGSPLTGYTATSNPGSFTCSASGSATNCTVTGLTNGTSYTFTVTATNAIGTGSVSAVSSQVIPLAVPGASGFISATLKTGGGQFNLLWSAPSSGGSPITSYTVTSSPAGLTCTTSGTSCSISSGLVDGTTYTFTVTATNTQGTGPASAPSSPVLAAHAPSPPASVVAVAGNTTAMVTWTQAANNNGSPITSYTATSTPSSKTCTTTPTDTTCLITGLINSLPYTFTVTATNAIGIGNASAPSNSVTPAQVPGPVTSITDAQSGNNQVTLEWSEDGNDGGSAILYYTVHVVSPGSDSGDSCRATPTPTGDESCAVTGLTNGTTYQFVVTATNAIGTSTPSSPYPGTAMGPPSTPTAPPQVSVTSPSSGNILLTFTLAAPATNGGAPIVQYSVSAVPNYGPSCTVNVSNNPSSVTCQVNTPLNGSSYQFQYTATNGNAMTSNPSPLTSSIVMDVPPSATGAPGVTQIGSVATVVLSGGAYDPTITSYIVYAVNDTTKSCSSTTLQAGCQITGLSVGVPYTFVEVAVNPSGRSPASPPSSPPTEWTSTPAPPTILSVFPGNGSAAVTWATPNDSGSPVTSYTAVALPGFENCGTTAPETTCTITGLTNGTTYTFYIQAYNSMGVSPTPAGTFPTVPQPPPSIAQVPRKLPIAQIGLPLKLGVTVLGAPPFVYTWIHLHGTATDTLHRDTSALLTDSLSLGAAAYADTGLYAVLVQNSLGSAQAVIDTLSALAPAVVSQPHALFSITGLSLSAKLGVTAAGSLPITYTWVYQGASTDTLRRDTLLSLADTLTLALNSLADTGTYLCRLTNGVGATLSDTALISVKPVVIATQPATALTVANGASAQMSVSVSGTPPFQYSWVRIQGSVTDTLRQDTSLAVTDTLSFGATPLSDSGTYKCSVRNFVSTVVSSSLVLTVSNAAALAAMEASLEKGIHFEGQSVVFLLPANAVSAQADVLDVQGRTMWAGRLDGETTKEQWNGPPGFYLAYFTAQDAKGQLLARLLQRFYNP